MSEPIELSRTVKVGRMPPDERELAALHRDGVRAVIDLRTDTEPFGPAPTPTEEAEVARALGIDYIRVPVMPSLVTRADLDRVGQALREAPKPVLIHCASGRRAGMAALAHTAIETGTPGAEMLEMARRLDVLLGDPAQQRIFAEYVDRRETGPHPLLRRHAALHGDPEPVVVASAGLRRIPSWRSPPVRLRTIAGIAGAILLVLDRRLRVPVLLAAGVVAGRAAMKLRAEPPFTPPAADPALDRDIDELGRRVRQLQRTA